MGQSAIPVRCACGDRFDVPAEYAGKRVRCRTCQEPVRVKAPVVSPSRRRTTPRATSGAAPPSRRRPAPSPDDEGTARREAMRRARAARQRGDEQDLEGFFAPEESVTGSMGGVAGGLLLMLGAVVWFVGGLAAGYIFFYPPVLFLFGLISMVNGMASAAPTQHPRRRRGRR